LRQGHEEGHRKALERFEAAVQAAPELPAAHAGVARAWLQLVATNIEPPQPGISRALQAAHAALALQAGHAEGLVLCAQLEQRFRYDWLLAAGLFARALKQAPESAFVRHAHAFARMLRREFDLAEAELAQARRLDPLHLGLRAHEALLHLYRRDWPAAEATLQALLDLSPDNVLGLSLLANVELLRGELAASLARYRRVQQLHPRLSIGWCGVAQVLALQGHVEAARAEVAALRERWAGHYASPYQLAMVALRLGDAGEAVDLLARAVDECDPNAVCLPVDPCFDGLADEPRFKALCQRVLGAAPAAAAAAVAAAP
jgi:tetratricopeptide (TPR) repeat protein